MTPAKKIIALWGQFILWKASSVVLHKTVRRNIHRELCIFLPTIWGKNILFVCLKLFWIDI